MTPIDPAYVEYCEHRIESLEREVAIGKEMLGRMMGEYAEIRGEIAALKAALEDAKDEIEMSRGEGAAPKSVYEVLAIDEAQHGEVQRALAVLCLRFGLTTTRD